MPGSRVTGSPYIDRMSRVRTNPFLQEGSKECPLAIKIKALGGIVSCKESTDPETEPPTAKKLAVKQAHPTVRGYSRGAVPPKQDDKKGDIRRGIL